MSNKNFSECGLLKTEKSESKVKAFTKILLCTLACSFAVFAFVFEVFEAREIGQKTVFAPSFSQEIDFEGDAVGTGAQSYILCDGRGRAIAGRNIDARLPQASLTKIMTGLLLAENTDGDEVFTVPNEAVGLEGSSIYLEKGEKITAQELLLGLMTESGNDAAVTAAVGISGSVEAFVSLMNKRAAELGLENTHFQNPHGLSAKGHYTSAADLAKLCAFALENPRFAGACACRDAKISDGKRFLHNHNRLLFTLDGCTGIKTGYTKVSGRTLATSCEREGCRFIAVTLNDRSDFSDHKRLYDYAFSNYEMQKIPAFELEINTVGGVKNKIKAKLPNIHVLTKKSADIETYTIKSEFLYAPIKIGDTVGKIEIRANGEIIGYADIKATEETESKKVTLFDKIKGLFFK